MTTEIGIVKIVLGHVVATAADGTTRVLQAGDKLFADELITTGGTGVIDIEFSDGSAMSLGRNSKALLDNEVFNPQLASDDVDADVVALQQALEEGTDPTRVGEATAAGAGAGAGGDGNEGVNLVQILHEESRVTPDSVLFETSGRGLQVQDDDDIVALLNDPSISTVNARPTAGITTVLLDEDDLARFSDVAEDFEGLSDALETALGLEVSRARTDGIDDEAEGDDLPPEALTILSGRLAVDFGVDGQGNIVFNASTDQDTGLTSGGKDIQYFIATDGHSLIAYSVNDVAIEIEQIEQSSSEEATIIFTAEITDVDTGAFRVVLYGAVDHQDGSTEDNLLANLGFTISDANGDTAAGILILDIDDDSPTVVSQSHAITVDEDGLAGANADFVRDGGIDSMGSVTATATGTFADKFSFGADGQGAAAIVSVNGIVADNGIITVETDAYRLEVTASTGDYRFTLLDNVIGMGPGENLQTGWDIALTVTAQDGDGDQVRADITLNVDVLDDVPVITVPQNSSVDEDGFERGNPNPSDSYSLVTVVQSESTGKVVDHWLFSHAGGQLTINIDSERYHGDLNGDNQLTSFDSYIYLINADTGATITKIDDSDETGVFSRDSFLNITLPPGNYDLAVGTWRLSESEAHSDVQDEDIATYNIIFGGDNGGVELTGLPTAGSIISGVSSGYLASEALVASASLGIQWGADDDNDGSQADRSVAFDADIAAPRGLTSNGLAVSYQLSENGSLLTAYTGEQGEANYSAVFTVSLSDLVNGSYNFELLNNLDHSTAGTIDEINLSFAFTAIDSDGDATSASFTVTVDDDAAVLESNSDTITVDEDGLSGANADDNRNGEVTGTGSASVTANFADNFSFGADGQGAAAIVSVNGVLADPTSGIITIETAGYSLFVTASTGAYTFTLLDNVIESGAGENLQTSFDIALTVIAQDGDGDQVTGNITLNVDVLDDVPVITVAQATEYEFTMTNHDVSVSGYGNSYGYYVKDPVTGEPTTGVLVWDNVDDSDTTALTVSGYRPEQIGFFIILNDENSNSAVEDNTEISFKLVASQWQAFDGITALTGNGSTILFDNASLNDDGQTHLVDNNVTGNQNWQGLPIPNDDGGLNEVNTNVVWNAVANKLQVDESNLGVDATVDFSGLFSSSFGADGEGNIVYSLTVNSGATGINDTATGEVVILTSNAAGNIEGRSQDSNDLVFTVSITGSEVTLDQARSVVHTDSNNHDSAISLASGLINMTAVITDADGDTASASLNLSSLISFRDDGPVLTSNSETITVDEDGLSAANADAGRDGEILGTASVSAAGNFADNFSFGADGQGAAAIVSVNGIIADNGIITVETDAYRLEVTASTGAYRFTLLDNVIEAGVGENLQTGWDIALTVIAQDGDGDQVSGDITLNVDVLDDVPVITVPQNVSVDEEGLEAGNPGVGPAAQAIFANTTEIRIPEGTSSYGDTSSTIEVSDLTSIADLDVLINLDHTYNADLHIFLISPNGTRVVLTAGNGANSDNFNNTLFDDEASSSITSATGPFTGIYQPQVDLSVFDGEDPNGMWTLEIRDFGALDTGTLFNWELQFNTALDNSDLAGEEIAVSASLGIQWGADDDNNDGGEADRSVAFDADIEAPPGLTSNSLAVSYQLSENGSLLTAYTGTQGDVSYAAVFTVSLSDLVNGSYDFELLSNLDHAIAATEDDINLSFAFTATDSDGDTTSASFSVTVDDDTPVLESNSDTITFDEDGLNGDNAALGHAGEEEGMGLASTTGNFADNFSFGADGQAAAAIVSVNGVFADPTTGIITLETEDYSFFVTASTGAYTITLLDNVLEEGTGENLQTGLAVNLSIVAEDGDGDQVMGDITLNVNVLDDIPVAADSNHSVLEGNGIDIVFIVDTSGSMTASSVNDVPDFSDDRIGLARYSMQQLLTNHPEVHNVQFTLFEKFASSTIWMTRADALSYIVNDDNFPRGRTTNYDAALQSEMDAYTESVRPAGNAGETVVYFLSDGKPYPIDTRIDDESTGSHVSIAEWETFVSNPVNDISNVFSIGIGSGVTAEHLNPIAYPNTVSGDDILIEDNVIVIADSDLAALTQTIDDLLSNVITNQTASSIDESIIPTNFGADGGHNLSIEINGTTYTWNGLMADESEITLTGVLSGTIEDVTSVTAATAAGGEMTFHFAGDAGDWSYTPPNNVADATPESFSYTIIDGDGDTASAVINITVLDRSEVTAYDNANQARVWQETVIEGGTVVATEILANFSERNNPASSGSNYNPWIFDDDNDSNVSGDETTVVYLANTPILTAAASNGDKWVSSSDNVPYVYRVDFSDVEPSNPDFDPFGFTDIITITINDTTYSSDGTNSSSSFGSQHRFDAAQSSLKSALESAGYSVTNNADDDSFDITTGSPATVSGEVVVGGLVFQSHTASNLTGSNDLDAGMSARRLVLEDQNGRDGDSAQLLSPEFTTAATGSTTLSFDYGRENSDNLDNANWTLYKNDGGMWIEVSGGNLNDSNTRLSTNSTVTTSTLDANSSYRLSLEIRDGISGNGHSQLSIDNIRLTTTSGGTATTIVMTAAVEGNVLKAPNTLISSSDPWAAVDDTVFEGAALMVWNGATFIDPTVSGTTVVGSYGSLEIRSDGSYQYTANADINNLNEQDVFTYQLTQADGDTDNAQLVITIVGTPYVEPTPLVGNDVVGTSADDVILGTADGDSLKGGAGNDHIEGGAGIDTIFGGAGDDVLFGGDDADTFVWNSVDVGTSSEATHDTVVDFDATEGDVIDLSDLLSDPADGYTIEGIEVGGSNNEHLQINIKDSDENIVQAIELNGVAIVDSAELTLQGLLDDGNIDNGII